MSQWCQILAKKAKILTKTSYSFKILKFNLFKIFALFNAKSLLHSQDLILVMLHKTNRICYKKCAL